MLLDFADLLRLFGVHHQTSTSGLDVVAENRPAAIHFPLPRAAESLSRVLSEMISRSNCAKESKMFSVRRPNDVVVLNFWVTKTKLMPRRSRRSIRRAKSNRDLLNRSTLYAVDRAGIDPG